jgi:hypothetical protein
MAESPTVPPASVDTDLIARMIAFVRSCFVTMDLRLREGNPTESRPEFDGEEFFR